MSWTLEQVTEKLGDKAQFTARGIVVLDTSVEGRPKHILVGEFFGETFHVTQDGLDYLSPNIEDAVIVSTKKSRGPKKELSAPEVDPVPAVAPEIVAEQVTEQPAADQ